MDPDIEEEFEKLDFMKKKVIKSGIQKANKRESVRGVPKNKKDDIVKKCVKLMPMSRADYWLNIAESNVSGLAVEYDNEIDGK